MQGHFIDNYFNLTLKTISMMKWISDYCYKVKYVLKVDDDMFVNMQNLTDFSETRYFNKCIIGRYLMNLQFIIILLQIRDRQMGVGVTPPPPGERQRTPPPLVASRHFSGLIMFKNWI